MRPNTPSTARVQKHRAKLRKAGMRPIQIWVPDLKSEQFIAECQRQSQLVAAADSQDTSLIQLMDESMNEVSHWE